MIRPGRPERTARIRLPAPRTHRGGPMAGSEDARITVTPNGPYHITGSVPLVPLTIVTDDDDFSVEWGGGGEPYTTEAGYDLCRCGGSKIAPFCDRVCDENG